MENKMNVTCGTDIIEINRIKKMIDSIEGTGLDKIYTKKEQEYCEDKGNMKYQHYAARFAAKEAIFKAISSRLDNKFDITWTDVEVLNDANGRPEVRFIEKEIAGIKNIEISLSHCKEFAVANVVAIWD